MKTVALTLAALVSLSAGALAQEQHKIEPSLLNGEAAWTSLEETLPLASSVDRSFEVPRTLGEPLGDDKEPRDGYKGGPFSLGAVGGYLRVKDADEGTWFGGVQARLRFGMLAAEASVQVHQDKYEDGDVVITQYPVQLTAFLYFIPEGPIRPYILGGVGWYYSRVDYRDNLNFIDDETDSSFGWHFGAGLEIFLADRISINGDVRYIFVDPDTEQVIDTDFNYWQLTFGLNFHF